ncbi:MAG: hypothetical protein ANABAC_0608 [Anaerolineae bacterium]|nr:MAG: hypothetical protein ANABAC_0608 [Anaerolineae bacterium]
MNGHWFGLIGAFLGLSCSLLNLLSEDWRKRVTALALQSIGVFLLCVQSISLTLALVKFIEGWMAAAILGTAMANVHQTLRANPSPPLSVVSLKPVPVSALVFRLAMALLVGLFIISGAPYLMSIFNGIRFTQTIAVLGLCGFGLLVLGFRPSTFSISIGLITFLNGFEILLAVIEPSVMLTGLIAGVVLSISFIGAYGVYFEGEWIDL